MQNVRIKKPERAVSGELFFPGDKSLSHRAIILAALAKGVSSFTNVLPAEDCVRTREAFRAMGVEMETPSPTDLVVHGRGLHSLREPQGELSLGNSGTSMRLLLGVLAGNPFQVTLTGDPSLSSRPMRRVTDYLRQMGASVEGRDNANYAPLTIRGGKLKGIDALLPIASAQVKSALLLAGLYAEGRTSVTEPLRSRDHTERFLSYFGVVLKEEGLKVSVGGGQELAAKSFEIAGDISSAAFFMALALLVPGSKILFRSVLWNPTRTGVLKILEKGGAVIRVEALHSDGPEQTADFTIEAKPLRAFEVTKEEIPSVIDELPILMVLATQAKGTSVIHEASELRVKETDRIVSMAAGLSEMGAKVEVKGDTIMVQGPASLHGARVSSFKDHRTAMSLLVAGTAAEGETVVEDVDCINTSFPSFFELLGDLRIPYELNFYSP
ncbi:MAG: 3-phosphoshikimate 1-carboxyvinyltransferase [Candidatus Omnitrophica bacterium]|nr:3-phosphoshikimate 1-carboxyvinyltransferase [Candidatus Omnitrophota bacterium]